MKYYKHGKPTYCPAGSGSSLGNNTRTKTKLDHWIFDVAKSELKTVEEDSTPRILILYFQLCVGSFSRLRGELVSLQAVTWRPVCS